MATLPKLTIGERIDVTVVESYARPHLGASQIGASCQRSVVYGFYWAGKRSIAGKLARIFSLGNHVEDVIIDSIRTVGINHYGAQRRISNYNGHGGGSVDGIVSNVPGFDTDEELLFEAKSMNHNNFLECKRKGVQESKPVYYAQLQMYMGRLQLGFAMFIAMDKNTAELYIEMVPFDIHKFDELVCNENMILEAQRIDDFPRIGGTKSWFGCKFCEFTDLCFDNATPLKNCRTCTYSKMINNGKWFCVNPGHEISTDDQEVGCSSYVIDGMWSKS